MSLAVHPFRTGFLLFLFSLAAFHCAAVPLRGTVTDPSGEALPFVSIYLENSTYGVASNARGQYTMELEPGTHRVVFQMLGYAKQVLEVTIGNTPITRNVVLEPEDVELAGVTVYASGKDPAYGIIEEAMAVRKKYLDQLEGYSRQTYVKATSESEASRNPLIDTATGAPVRERMNFVESYSTVYYSHPDKQREVKTAYRDLSEKSQVVVQVSFNFDDGTPRQTGQMNPYLYYLNASDGNFNFYQNRLDLDALGDLPYLSPIANGAMVAYKYELEETFQENGRTIFKIRVIPRLREGALFEGHIFIEDKTWAISAIDLEVVPGSMRFFRYFRVIQQYEVVQDSLYLPVREEFFYHALDGMKLVISNTIALHSDYEINPDFPKNFFSNELRRVEDDAYDKDSAFWAELRPVTLKVEEQNYVSKQDSIRLHHNSPEYKREQDSLYNHMDWLDILVGGFGRQNSFKGTRWYSEGLLFQARPLMVGGYHQALSGSFSKTWSRAHRLSVRGEVNYGFRNQDVKGFLNLGFQYLPKKFGEIYVEGGDNYTMINSFDALENVLSRSNYINQTSFGVGHKMEFFNGFFADLKMFYEFQRPITGLELAPWSQELFGEANLPEDFDPYRQLLFEARVSYTPGQEYYLEPYRKVNLGSTWPTFKLHYRKGIPTIFGSQVNFDFLELSATQQIELKAFGTTRYNVFAGRFLNDRSVRFIEHKWFRGSDRFLLSQPLLSYQLLGPSINTKQAYLQMHGVHHFNGTILNKVPLINRLRLQLAGGAGMLLIQENGFRHAELFAGIERPIKIRSQLFKLGVYGAISDSNVSTLDTAIKIGFNIYDPFSRTWMW